jgi:outer membrane protein TolC
VIAERNGDPRWCVDDYGAEADPRSRYFDPYDPDRPPMPPDDPTSHQYMHFVDGKKGWRCWHRYGDRTELENPAWREALGDYAELGEDGAVKLNVESALKLAYVHSPSHRDQLETLYLSALDVTAERFRLDCQFFGGYDTRYLHQGSLIPAGMRYVPALGRFVVFPPINEPGAENNLLTVGRPSAENPAVQMQRRFATAGELLVGLANSFVFEFTGGDADLAASLINFSFFQPLLRGAGKDVALEGLTFRERALLADLRAYSQYRQGFYTDVAIGELGVSGPRRGGGSTSVASFSGFGGLGGYVGLLQQLQQIRNTEDSLNLQLRTLARLEAFLDVGVIDLVQVDEFRQDVESARANLLLTRNSFDLALDRYKTDTLGLPPDLAIELDDSLIRQFQFVAREATSSQDSIVELQGRVGRIAELQDLVAKIADLQDRLGQLPDEERVEPILQFLGDVFRVVEAVRRQLDDVERDLVRLEEAGPAGEEAMTDAEGELTQLVREKLREGPAALEQEFEEAKDRLDTLRDGLSEETIEAVLGEVVWFRDLLRVADGCILVQARVHLELESIRQVLSDVFELVEPVRRQLDDVEADLARMEEGVPLREQTMTDEDKKTFQTDREQLRQGLAELNRQFDEAQASLEGFRDGLTEETKRATTRGLVVWLSRFYRLGQVSILVQARARLETVTVETFELSSQNAFEIALANRLDFMNARAALTDRWRSIQLTADSLQSVLNVTASGDLRTARNNPVSFRAPTGTVRLGLEFDAPFTRLLERNDYRESLIEYQRSRRGFIQSRDALHLGLRALLRDIEQLREDLEIQRRAVAIAIRRVDMTQAQLYAPVEPPAPGQRAAQFGPSAARQLLSAQSALRDTQNRFLRAWLNYYAAKMRLARELGIMMLDAEGRWIDTAIPSLPGDGPLDGDEPIPEDLPFPPLAIPAGWVEPVQWVPEEPDPRSPIVVQSLDEDAGKGPTESAP